MSKIVNFLKDVKFEMSRVNWPKRDQLIKYTMVVIFMSIILAIFLGGLDILFTFILNKLLF